MDGVTKARIKGGTERKTKMVGEGGSRQKKEKRERNSKETETET